MSNMLESKLSGDAKVPHGIKTRFNDITEAAARDLRVDVTLDYANAYREAARAGSDIHKDIKRRIHEAQKFPDVSQEPRSAAKALADDFTNLAKVVEARTQGKYLQYVHADGTTETGVVTEVNGERVRDGEWISRDDKGRARQIGSFKEGKPHGTFRNFREDKSLESTAYFKDGVQEGTAYRYNAESKIIHKEYFENGKKMHEEAVDPERAAAVKALNTARISR